MKARHFAFKSVVWLKRTLDLKAPHVEAEAEEEKEEEEKEEEEEEEEGEEEKEAEEDEEAPQFYIYKLPINHPCGRYVTVLIQFHSSSTIVIRF